MERVRWLVGGCVVVALLAVGAAGCDGDQPSPPDADPGLPKLVLKRAPVAVREGCREIAAEASTEIRCPTRLPAPKHDGDRWILVKGMKDLYGREIIGVEINYVAKRQPALQNNFIHVYLAPARPYTDRIPGRPRPASFGGRPGAFVPATGHDPQNNHFNFFCRPGTTTRYWVSVHNVGRGTRQLLSAMVAQLEPVT